MLRLANHRAVTLDLHGELDLSREDEVAARIGGTVSRAGVSDCAVDLADVTFLDCHTIGILLRGQRLAAARGVRMHVVNAVDPKVRSILDITGAAAQLESSTDATRPGRRVPPGAVGGA